MMAASMSCECLYNPNACSASPMSSATASIRGANGDCDVHVKNTSGNPVVVANVPLSARFRVQTRPAQLTSTASTAVSSSCQSAVSAMSGGGGGDGTRRHFRANDQHLGEKQQKSITTTVLNDRVTTGSARSALRLHKKQSLPLSSTSSATETTLLRPDGSGDSSSCTRSHDNRLFGSPKWARRKGASVKMQSCPAPTIELTRASTVIDGWAVSKVVAGRHPGRAEFGRTRASPSASSAVAGVAGPQPSRTQRIVKRLSLKKRVPSAVEGGGSGDGDLSRGRLCSSSDLGHVVVVPLGTPDLRVASRVTRQVCPARSSGVPCCSILREEGELPTTDRRDKLPPCSSSARDEGCSSVSSNTAPSPRICCAVGAGCEDDESSTATRDESSSDPPRLYHATECSSSVVDSGSVSVGGGGSGTVTGSSRHLECTSSASTPMLRHKISQKQRPSATSVTATSASTASSSGKISNFFSKRSFKGNPLKRTKSVTKLDRKRFTSDNEDMMTCRLRSSRSHESLLSNHSVASGSDLTSPGPEGSHVLDVVNGGVVDVKPLHSSILGQQHCIQVTSGGTVRYYSCRTADERDRWLHSLRCTVQPDRDRMHRVDHSLRIWLLEAKHVASKKRYHCRLLLDGAVYARTASKSAHQLCFWGELFEFSCLPSVNTLTVALYREPGDRRRKKDKNLLVGSVEIPVSSVSSRFFVEKWYPITCDKLASNKPIPSVRIKCRYQTADILPLACYTDFLHYLTARYRPLCGFLEPLLGVKYKEDIAVSLVSVMQREGLAKYLLADLVIMDVVRIDDERLTFRGNSLATKATESFMRLVGERYLSDTLTAPIRRLLDTAVDLEVDPLKVASASSLQRQRATLRAVVQDVWNCILASSANFPRDLRDCFHMVAYRLKEAGKLDQCDNVVSSCIFLRFFCPAILSPSLFGLVQEYPDERGVRNLTLVAKTLQTLANFTQFQGKESYMEFLNDFVVGQALTMRMFLRKITVIDEPCGGSGGSGGGGNCEWFGVIDLGRQLSLLHSLLRECVAMTTKSGQADPQQQQSGQVEQDSECRRLIAALDSVSDVSPTQQYSPLQSTAVRCGVDQSSVYDPTSTLPNAAVSVTASCLAGGDESSHTAAATTTTCSSTALYQRRRKTPTATRHTSLATSCVAASTTAAVPGGDTRACTLPRHNPPPTSANTAAPDYGTMYEPRCGRQAGQYGGGSAAAVSRARQHVQYPSSCGAARQEQRRDGMAPSVTNNTDNHGRLGAVSGSQMSISQVSTVASSGYHSLTANCSHSSSPVDSSSGGGGASTRLPDTTTSVHQQALVFNNPMYQLKSTNTGDRSGRPCFQRSVYPSCSHTTADNSSHHKPVVVGPSVAARLLSRSSSSSPSPPRERRPVAAVLRTSVATPSADCCQETAAAARQRRLKANRRTSVDVLAARRQQLRDSDSDSSIRVAAATASTSAVPGSTGTGVLTRPAARETRLKAKNRRSRINEKTFEEYEEEIRALQCQMEQLQSRLDEELKPQNFHHSSHVHHQSSGQRGSGPPASSARHSNNTPDKSPISEILNRLSAVEDELRREQGQLSCVLSEKDQIIVAQNRRIQQLNAANCQLLACLQESAPPPASQPASVVACAAGGDGSVVAPPPGVTATTAAVSDTSDYKSSSC